MNDYRLYVNIRGLHPAVTGSMLVLEVNFPYREKYRFAIDCGMFQEDYIGRNLTLPCNLEELECILLTHAHNDHIGRMPFMVKKGFRGKIFATKASCELIPTALKDSAKILGLEAKYKKMQPLYTKKDVYKSLFYLDGFQYNEFIQISRDIRIMFLQNGHLPGAAMIYIEISYPDCETINLLFTGDYKDTNIFYDVPEVPKWILEKPITVIQESTYGASDSLNIEKCFEKNILKCLNDNGTVIIPVFALARTQEILFFLKNLQEEGKLKPEIPIFLDGNLAIAYTSIFEEAELGFKQEMKNFLPENFIEINKTTRPALLFNRSKKIILATAGMAVNGPIQQYLPCFLGRRQCLIHFVGYCAEGTLGRELLEAQYGDSLKINGKSIQKIAEVKATNEFSSHARGDELLDFLKQFQNLKMVLINHGEIEIQKIYQERVLTEVKPKNVQILGCEEIVRINPFGFVKRYKPENL